jgi:hypothetical protein
VRTAAEGTAKAQRFHPQETTLAALAVRFFYLVM